MTKSSCPALGFTLFHLISPYYTKNIFGAAVSLTWTAPAGSNAELQSHRSSLGTPGESGPHQASSSLQPPGKGLAHCIAVAGCGTLVFDAGTEVGEQENMWDPLWDKIWLALGEGLGSPATECVIICELFVRPTCTLSIARFEKLAFNWCAGEAKEGYCKHWKPQDVAILSSYSVQKWSSVICRIKPKSPPHDHVSHFFFCGSQIVILIIPCSCNVSRIDLCPISIPYVFPVFSWHSMQHTTLQGSLTWAFQTHQPWWTTISSWASPTRVGNGPTVAVVFLEMDPATMATFITGSSGLSHLKNH